MRNSIRTYRRCFAWRGGGLDHVYVWAEVNDELEGWFLLDTGAANNLLSTSAAEQLGLDLVPAGTMGGVGASVKAYRARADTLRVGPLTLTSPRFQVSDVDASKYRHQLGRLGGACLNESVVVYDCARPAGRNLRPGDL